MGGTLTVSGAGLTLAVVAVVIACHEGRVDVDGVGDCLTETVAVERHDG